MGVLLYHIRVDLWVGWWRIKQYPQDFSTLERTVAWLSIPTPFLGYSVILFFLISGFCIHYPNTSLSKELCWLTYFKRRFWRIYPTYLIAILITTLISWYCHIQWNDATWDWTRILRVVSLSQNYPPNSGQFLTNPSLWTIPLETEFYLLYPCAFLIIMKFGFVRLISLAILISSISILLMNYKFQWISFTAVFLWPSWLLGAFVAYLYRENKLPNLNSIIITIALIIFLAFSLCSLLGKWVSWIHYASWTGFYFFLFLLFIQNENMIMQFRNNIFFVTITWLGKISFSLYLVHFPLFKLFGYWHREIFSEKPANFLITLCYLIPVVLLAWCFFHIVENPIHLWSKSRKDR